MAAPSKDKNWIQSLLGRIDLTRIGDSLLVIVVSPILLLAGLAIAFLVRANLGKPIFYTQVRDGYLGRKFRIRKFRSMSNQHDPMGNLLPDEQRLTRFGRLIRTMRLDELPSFWHILTGKIALVGPRPLLPSTVENHRLGGIRRQVRPGFTGLAQVSGNTLLSEDEKFALDCYFISKKSLWLSFEIILKTLKVITTMEKRDEVEIGKALAYCDTLTIGQHVKGSRN